MFGYVRVRKPELRIREYDCYKCYYCGLCRSLKKSYGVSAELLLSYDLTFLTLLLSSVYDLKTRQYKSRCIVHPFKKQTRIETEADSYSSAMSILLGYLHFDDDINDSGSIKASFGKLLFKRRALSIEKKYPRQAEALRKELSLLHGLENQGSHDIDALCSHFGNALGEIFVWRDDIFSGYFRQMGYYMGRFIYLMDAVDDWEKDRKNSEFNPYSDMTSQKAVMEKARPLLMKDISAAAAAFEMLPAVENAELLRNIIYAGVWNRFDKLTEDLNESI
ncbi:MAG: DUF5685 family protein [Candidatus Weimeria sp.]